MTDQNNVAFSPIWRNAAKNIASAYDYGSIVTEDQLKTELEITFPEVTTCNAKTYREKINEIQYLYERRLKSLRNALLVEHKMEMVYVGESTYKILTPAEQSERAEKKTEIDINNALRRGFKKITNVAYDKLDANQQSEHQSRLARCGLLWAKAEALVNSNKQRRWLNDDSAGKNQPEITSSPGQGLDQPAADRANAESGNGGN